MNTEKIFNNGEITAEIWTLEHFWSAILDYNRNIVL